MTNTLTITQKRPKHELLSTSSLKAYLVLLGTGALAEGDMALVDLITRLIQERRWDRA
jgi:hypothetical protein